MIGISPFEISIKSAAKIRRISRSMYCVKRGNIFPVLASSASFFTNLNSGDNNERKQHKCYVLMPGVRENEMRYNAEVKSLLKCFLENWSDT